MPLLWTTETLCSKILILAYQRYSIFCPSNFEAEAFPSVILSYHIVARTGVGSREIQPDLSLLVMPKIYLKK